MRGALGKVWICALAFAALGGVASRGEAQGPVLVRDIATGPVYWRGPYVSPPVRFRGEDYFGADDGFLGHELWATNGTLRGTRLVADLCPGRCQGGPWVITPSGGLLYFYADNTTSGFSSVWLWRSDGTSAGTFPLADLELGSFGSAGPVSYLAPFQGGVVFIAHDRVRRAWNLWSSDGTPAGTRPIAPLPGRFGVTSPWNYPDWPRAQDDPGRHYFTWQRRLWVTDGTAAGTGRAVTPVRPCGGGWARTGRLVVYAGEDEAAGCEPWVSDGTGRGTRRLRDVWPGDGWVAVGPFFAAGGLVYFTAVDDHNHMQLWKTNGTPRGTVLVRAPGTRGLGKVTIVGVTGPRVYFAADDGEHGVELWQTDGSPASTALVADLTPGAAGSSLGIGQSLGAGLIFVARVEGESNATLFHTEGRAGSTVRLASLGVAGDVLSAAGGRVYFTSTVAENDQELGVTDGTVEGTRILGQGRPVASSNPHQLIAGPGGLVFLAGEGDYGTDLWRSGGHREDTEPLADLVPGYNYSDGMSLEAGSGGAFYYVSDERRFGWTDGQTVRDLLPPESLYLPEGFVDLGDRTLFFAPRPVSDDEWIPWLWSSDGTVDGTSAVARTGGGSGDFYSFRFRAGLVPDAGDVRFLVQDAPYFPEILSKLSATDGTAAGTRELVQIPIRRYQYLDQMVAAGGSVFASFWSDSRASLWASDGTAEGTREVYTIIRPYDLSFLSGLTAAGTQAFFLGDDFERGRELWASDGTPEGTHRVADLAPGAASSTPTDLAAFGDRVLFSADDGPHGRELWVSDGTDEGTHLLEIQPGPRGSYPQAFRVIGDRAVFAADDGVHGLELWVTDGTPQGTRLAADVMAGLLPSSPRDFAVYGTDLLFNAGRPGEGYELWKLPLEALER